MDILTIGEVLIDLTQTGKDARGIPQFAANPGGAPANLAVAASRLGAQTAFIGKVGADAFGRYLKEVLAENKVDVSGMAVDADHPTTMAVVSVDATGERDFSFYRSANADVMLCKEDISDEALKAAKIVHFGSVSLTADPSRTATLDAAARAKKLGATITYDPNYRANLWKNKEDAIAQMKAPLPLVDILKVSDEELPLLTGTTDCESGTAQLAQNGIRLIFVTLGANGVFYRFGEKTGHVAGVPCKVGDTNGAGDTFFGAALSKLCKEELDTLTVDKLESILAFANKAASITTSLYDLLQVGGRFCYFSISSNAGMAGIAPWRLVVMLAALLAKARMPSSLSTVRVSSSSLQSLDRAAPKKVSPAPLVSPTLQGTPATWPVLSPKR